jgi:NADH-quinone oxidoreductase subunit H
VPFGGTLVPGRLVNADMFPSLAAGLQSFFGERSYTMQVAGLDAGILFVLAISGIGVLGTMLAGWSSNNKFSLMGASRAASQMISYEVAMGLALISMVATYGTLDLDAMVKWQSGLLLGVVPAWGLFVQPVAFVLFLTASIAENKRIPFDLPEAESELVAGYFTEYTSMKMGLFMLSEFIEIVVISALVVTLFLGGYNLPYMNDAGFAFPGGSTIALPHAVVVLLQLGIFLAKVLVVCSFQILVRWSLPRFRYDQLLAFAWKFMFPLALANLVATALVLWLMERA